MLLAAIGMFHTGRRRWEGDPPHWTVKFYLEFVYFLRFGGWYTIDLFRQMADWLVPKKGSDYDKKGSRSGSGGPIGKILAPSGRDPPSLVAAPIPRNVRAMCAIGF